MMDREKRRNIIRKIVRFWFTHNLEIAITVAVSFIVITVTVLCVCLDLFKSNDDSVTEDATDYSSVFEVAADGGSAPKKKRNTVTNAVGEVIEEEVEYSTLLQYNANTKNGYMNNCIFLGDSRTVAMVSYGFVSDENVLAKIGISHPSVLNATFTQNSGKEYTVKQYLASHQAPVIYLAFGVNGMGGSDEKYEKSFKELVEAIMEMAPDSEIVIMAIGPVDDYGPYKKTCQNSWIDKYNDFLYALAEYEGIYYLDVDTILKDTNGQVKPEYDAGDGLHYKACAYTAMLEYIIHHPVPGISDEGEFVVKYVKPTGQFKKMVKDEAALPSNAVVEEQVEPAVSNIVQPEGVQMEFPSPSPLIIEWELSTDDYPVISLSPSPSPFIVEPSPAVVPGAEQNLPTPTPVPGVDPTVGLENVPDTEVITPTVEPVDTDGPLEEPQTGPTVEADASTGEVPDEGAQEQSPE